MAKNDAILELEGRLEQLTALLQTASADIESKRSEVKELEEAKRLSEKELKDLQDALEKSVAHGESSKVLLQNARKEVSMCNAFRPWGLTYFFTAGRGKGCRCRAD